MFDSTLPLLLSGGYNYIRETCDRLGSDYFETRLLLRPAVCVLGEDAARMFYDESLLERRGAIPRRVLDTLFGKGGIHGLDGEEHRRRKRTLMSLMTEERLAKLARISRQEWELAADRWAVKDSVILHDEAREILCRAICRWAGIPLSEDEARLRADDFGAMIDAFGAIGPRFWRGKRARKRTERWLRRTVKFVRAKGGAASARTPLEVIAFQRNGGRVLPLNVATVELINLIRPTVAVAYLITFAAVALHEHPDCRRKLSRGGSLEHFAQEVRRFYPFAPFLGAVARKKFTWKGHKIRKGTLVILDIYGTNHDRRIWSKPDCFWPERFAHWSWNPFNFIPQGGGDELGHRCAGEAITLLELELATEYLSRELAYKVSPQDLSVPMTRFPSLPASRFVMKGVRRRSEERKAA